MMTTSGGSLTSPGIESGKKCELPEAQARKTAVDSSYSSWFFGAANETSNCTGLHELPVRLQEQLSLPS